MYQNAQCCERHKKPRFKRHCKSLQLLQKIVSRRAPEIDEAFQGISIFDVLELFSQAKDGPNITHFVNSVIILGMGYHGKKGRKRKDIESVG